MLWPRDQSLLTPSNACSDGFLRAKCNHYHSLAGTKTRPQSNLNLWDILGGRVCQRHPPVGNCTRNVGQFHNVWSSTRRRTEAIIRVGGIIPDNERSITRVGGVIPDNERSITRDVGLYQIMNVQSHVSVGLYQVMNVQSHVSVGLYQIMNVQSPVTWGYTR